MRVTHEWARQKELELDTECLGTECHGAEGGSIRGNYMSAMRLTGERLEQAVVNYMIVKYTDEWRHVVKDQLYPDWE